MYPNPLEQAALDFAAGRLASKARPLPASEGAASVQPAVCVGRARRDGCGRSAAPRRWRLWTLRFWKGLKDRADPKTVD